MCIFDATLSSWSVKASGQSLILVNFKSWLFPSVPCFCLFHCPSGEVYLQKASWLDPWTQGATLAKRHIKPLDAIAPTQSVFASCHHPSWHHFCWLALYGYKEVALPICLLLIPRCLLFLLAPTAGSVSNRSNVRATSVDCFTSWYHLSTWFIHKSSKLNRVFLFRITLTQITTSHQVGHHSLTLLWVILMVLFFIATI